MTAIHPLGGNAFEGGARDGPTRWRLSDGRHGPARPDACGHPVAEPAAFGRLRRRLYTRESTTDRRSSAALVPRETDRRSAPTCGDLRRPRTDSHTSDSSGCRAPPRALCAGAFLVRAFEPACGTPRNAEGGPMATAEKQAAIAELADSFRGSNAAVLTEYRGLTVKQLSELRRHAARPRHLRRGEEHPHRARGQGGRGHRVRRPARRADGHRLRHRRPGRGGRRACATSPRPTRCSSSRAAFSTARP